MAEDYEFFIVIQIEPGRVGGIVELRARAVPGADVGE
jgi:hypothetical protein